MSDQLATRVRSAATAGWWTILIAMIWMTAGWLLWVFWLLPCQPSWVITLWGGQEFLNWQDVYNVFFAFMAAWKLMLFALVLATIWLSLWARKLKRAA